MLLACWLLLACGGGSSPAPDPSPAAVQALPALVREACAPYADDAELLPHCLVRQAPGLPDAQAVDTVCSLAGALEDECRQLWTQRQLGSRDRYQRSELIDACGTNPDCAFEVIDLWPAETVDQQIRDCHRAGPYAHSCVRHALNRWRATDPDAAEADRLGQQDLFMRGLVAEYLAVRVQCDRVGQCPKDGLIAQDCQDWVGRFQANDGLCPRHPGLPEGGASGVRAR